MHKGHHDFQSIKSIIILVVLGFSLLVVPTPTSGRETDSLVLALFEVNRALQESGLPTYAKLTAPDGIFLALVLATRDRLEESGLAHEVLDRKVPSGTRYLIASEKRAGALSRTARDLRIIYDDGQRIIVRDEPGLAHKLALMGFSCRMMSDAPLVIILPDVLRRPRAIIELPLTPDSTIQAMMDRVSETGVREEISGLSGETAVMVEGAPYTFITRNNNSGEPIQKAARYILERLTDMGIPTSEDHWRASIYEGRNIVGEIKGQTRPDEIIIMVAHLDSINGHTNDLNAPAPGADDNASGCAALLEAAAIIRRHRFERTIRFVFTTGEEYGLLGSAHYAQAIYGQNILAVINLDMIAYSTQDPPRVILGTRVVYDPGYPEDLEIAETFIQVVNNYGLTAFISPTISADSDEYADQYSFWQRNMPALMVIEDYFNNFNPKYHSADDRLNVLNLPYAAAQVKAALGTTAHLAMPTRDGDKPDWLEGVYLLLGLN